MLLPAYPIALSRQVHMIMELALDDSESAWSNYTFRDTFANAVITVPIGSATQIRITLKSGTTDDLDFDKCYFGHLSGSYGFATAYQFLFSGVAGGSIPAGGNLLTSDWKNFVYDKSSGLCSAVYCSTAASYTADDTGLGGNYNRYYKAGDDAANESPSGYTGPNSGRISAVAKFEVR